MLGLFVALGIAILTLLAILLWFVPHLLQQHEARVAAQSDQLHEMISEMMHEQDVLAMRQTQLGTSIAYLQDQIEQLVSIGVAIEDHPTRMLPTVEPDTIQAIEERMSSLQVQIDRYAHTDRTRTRQENESWLYLLGLLGTIQEHIRHLSPQQPPAALGTLQHAELSCKDGHT